MGIYPRTKKRATGTLFARCDEPSFSIPHPLAQHKTKTAPTLRMVRFSFGGDDGDRTHYLLNAIQALSQVSYTPVFEVRVKSE